MNGAVRGWLAAVLFACLAGCGQQGAAPLVGTLERDRLELTAESADPLLSLTVREGESVDVGQVLARQDDSSLAAELAGARARAAQARALLDERTRGPRPETIRQARSREHAAQIAADSEAREAARLAGLIADHLVARTTLDRQIEARDRAGAALAEARAAREELTRGTRAEQIAQAKAALAESEAEVSRIETRLARLTLRAPRRATVEALPYRVGERPAVGAPVVVLLADDAPFARVYVPEPQRAGLVAGTRASVSVDGVAQAYPAQLRYVASQAAYTPYYALSARDRSRLSFLAEFTLQGEGARGLPSGVPVQVALAAPPP